MSLTKSEAVLLRKTSLAPRSWSNRPVKDEDGEGKEEEKEDEDEEEEEEEEEEDGEEAWIETPAVPPLSSNACVRLRESISEPQF